MLNQIVLMGRLEALEENKLTMHFMTDNIDIDIAIDKGLHSRIVDIAEIGTMIGIKGKVTLNENKELGIYSDKITVLQKAQEVEAKKAQKKKRNEYER